MELGFDFSISNQSVPGIGGTESPILASDSFNRANGSLGTTDGQGHTGAVQGDGLTWVDQIATVGIKSNRASALTADANRSIATVDVGDADVVITGDIRATFAPAGFVVRYADSSNYVYTRVDSATATAQIRKVISGSETTVKSNPITYVESAELKLTAVGDTFTMFYNGVNVTDGSVTISDSAVQSPTLHGVRFAGVGSIYTVDNFVVRGA